MKEAETAAIKAVDTSEYSARPQDPGHLRQQSVLQGHRRDVVEHGEAQRSIETCSGKAHGRGILVYHGHVLSTHPAGQRTGESAIYFDAGETFKTVVEKLRCDSRPRTNFQYIRSH